MSTTESTDNIAAESILLIRLAWCLSILMCFRFGLYLIKLFGGLSYTIQVSTILNFQLWIEKNFFQLSDLLLHLSH
ncbi:hypothetical protein SAMN05421821_10174 [Mucilaginibacter lappiensis]|uniref:Uncharacterized protein n=1 Tax=Mucilaginibacter lappiensis TaxID=354630 RepID=A0A1N6NBZ0_9SPHI|nr:hypothetical protein [Mucilaginibacter lappiensis]MBB6125915.1 hypothetical protein [Mucilaginibacter lappiensis]SIP89609.1 hypothetical protein SAMN05421821_10174 [Mucilaginibacter lappiensis]